MESLAVPVCPECGSSKVFCNGHRLLSDGSEVQRFKCPVCLHRFSDPSILKSVLDISESSRISADKVKNLATQQEIELLAGIDKATELTIRGEITQFPIYCQKEAMRASTVKTFNRTIRRLAKVANLHDTEAMKVAISVLKKQDGKDVDENTKVAYCIAYTAFLRSINQTWEMPKYQYSQKLPEFLPSEKEVDALIAGAGPKIGPLLQLMKETGMRLNECLSLTWMCVNFDTKVITLTKAEKHSLPRVFRGSIKLLEMLGNLPKQSDKLFGFLSDVTAESCIKSTRKKVARYQCNPRIAKIHFHLIRHYYGTLLYHRTHDIFYVSKMLGHKSVLHTQIYINLEQMMFSGPEDEYIGLVCKTPIEKLKAIELGYEFVSVDPDGTQYFRKLKR